MEYNKSWHSIIPVVFQKGILITVLRSALLIVGILVAMFGPFGWIVDFGFTFL